MREFWGRTKAAFSRGWAKVRGWAIGILIALGLITGGALAAPKDFNWTNPTLNTDGSVFDPATEQQEVRIYCSSDINTFVPESPGAPQTETPTLVVPGAATTATRDFAVGYYECFATVVSVYGYESDSSNLTQFDVLPTVPPQAIQDFSVSD